MSSIPVESTPAETKLAQAFSRMGEGARPSDFARRETAFRAFQTLGIPGSKVEEFKYTDLRERIGDIPPPAGPSDDKRNASILSRESAFEDIPAYRFSFVDGRLARREPVGNGDSTPFVETESWSGALSRGDADISLLDGVKGLKDNALYQLNSALRTPDDPALNLNIVRVRAGARLEKPLHFRFCTGEAAVTAASRVAVVVEDGASATILESHEGAGDAAHFLDDVFLLRLGRGARVTHVRVNAQTIGARVLSTLVGSLGDESVLRTCHVALGGEVGRHQIFCAYHGRDAEAYVNGIQMVRGNELIDTTLLMDHVEPGGISRELFKTVVRDSGVGVFQGKIIVEPFAQKSDGRMMSAALLLSENAAMNNKPELEIYADDVVCAHGATCGQPDEDLLFYLMTRGIPRIEAEALVLRAFLGEALEGLEHPGVVEDIEKYIGMWLHSQVA